MNDRAPKWPPSLWTMTAEAAPSCPALAGDEQADVVIVGGGFTGLSAALHLAEAGKSVRVLETVGPGWGASGRNGGQVNPAWKVLPQEMESRYGADRGRRVAAMASATCDLVFDLIERLEIQCDPVRPGYLQGAFGVRGRNRLEAWVRQWSARGAPVEMLSREQTASLIGTDVYDCGMLDRRGGNIQPLSYARGLARAAIAAGARIHGESPATGLHRHGAGWQVSTPSGRVSAEKVLVCTNGYTENLWSGLRAAIVPAVSFIAATKPLSDSLSKTILPERHAVSETRRVPVYYRKDRDGRFVIGGRGNLLNAAAMGDDAHVLATALRMFPQLAEVEWEFHWGGYVAMTTNWAPMLMRLAPGVYAGMGYNGRGIAMATMMGKQLAAALLGEDPDIPVMPLTRIPFHTFHQVGMSWYLITGQWLDRLDQSARRR